MHRPGTILPLVRPCEWSNGSDLGCCHFCNYKHFIQFSLDGQWIDGGELPLLLGTFTAIPKAPSFLDVVHIDIAFGDCVLVGGFRYSLIFLTKQLVTTECLASRIFPVPRFLRLSVSSERMLVLMLGVSSVIVMPNFLG